MRLLLAVAVVVLGSSPSLARAHAQLISTSPAENAVVAHEPAVVSFTFGESVGIEGDAVRVFDHDGRQVDSGGAFHPGGRGATAGVHLRPGLAKGTYTATYRVVSADTHIVTGGFVFSIGSRGASGGATLSRLVAGGGSGGVSDTAFAAARAVQYGAIGVAAGLFVFLLVVWFPALLRAGSDPDARRTASTRYLLRARTILSGCCVAGVVSALVGIVLQGAEARGIGFWHAIGPATVSEVLPTRFGVVWGAGLVAWLLVLTALVGPLARDWVAGLVPRPVTVRGTAQPASVGATGAAVPSARTRWGLVAPLGRGWAARLIPREGVGARGVALRSARVPWRLTAIGVPLAVARVGGRAADRDRTRERGRHRTRERARSGILSDAVFVAGLLVLSARMAPLARDWPHGLTSWAGRRPREGDPAGAGVGVMRDRESSVGVAGAESTRTRWREPSQPHAGAARLISSARADGGSDSVALGTRQRTQWDRLGEVPWPVRVGATGVALPSARTGWPLAAVGVPLAVLLVLPALAGHATIQHPVWLFAPMNVVHVAAMAVWLGGLVGLLGGALTLPRGDHGDRAVGTRTLAAALVRFSPIAFGCVVVLIVTGVVQALIEVSAWSQFVDTAYGRAILVKIAALSVLIALGARQRRRSIPAVRAAAEASAPPAGSARLLVQTLGAELAMLIVVLAAVGSLAGSAPARAQTGASTIGNGTAHNGVATNGAASSGPATNGAAPNAAASSGLATGGAAPNAAAINAENGMAGMTMPGGVKIPVLTATVVGGARIDISVTPGTVGQNTIALTLVDNRTIRRFTATKQLTVTATLTAQHIGPLTFNVRRIAPGRYVTEGAVLGAPGVWTLQITDRTSEFDQSQGTVLVPIN